MRVEWTHYEESGHGLELWTADYQGVRLTIEYIPETNVYAWRNNLTGPRYQAGFSKYDLDNAMRLAVRSVP